MMSMFSQLAVNLPLWASVTSWIVAQALKVLTYALVERKWEPNRFWGLGGMPSSHSSVVCTLTTSVGLYVGFDSPLFALCVVFSFIVMTDAAGVRRAAGKQAAVINKIVREISEPGHTISYETLKELLGHSPFEVFVGAILGVGIALIFFQIVR